MLLQYYSCQPRHAHLNYPLTKEWVKKNMLPFHSGILLNHKKE